MSLKAMGSVTLINIDDGEDGRSIISTQISYASSSSCTLAPTADLTDANGLKLIDSDGETIITTFNWQNTPPYVEPGYYLWIRTVFTYSDNTTSATYAVSGNGETGSQGVSIVNVIPEYTSSTSSTYISEENWSTIKPEITVGNYLWTRQRNELSDGTVSYSPAICDITISGVLSDIDQVKGQITNKVWQSDINTSIDSYDGTTVSTIRDRVSATEQNISGITTRVSDVESTTSDIETRLTSAESSITQNADNIELKVSKDGVIASINESPESITISAEKVNIAGSTSFTSLSNKVTAVENLADRNSELIHGTQTAGTYSWTGTSTTISQLTDGMEIRYWLPFSVAGGTVSGSYSYYDGSKTTTGTNTGVGLTLTLKDGTMTEEIPVYYSSMTRLTTHYPYGNIIRMIYRENVKINNSNTTYYTVEKGFWCDANYDTNSNYVQYSYGVTSGANNGVYQYSLLMRDSANTWVSIATSDGTGTSKSAYTGGLYYDKVLYHDSGTNYASNKTTGAVYDSIAFDLRYSTNCGTTLTNRKPVYLVGTINNTDKRFYLDTTQWWTQTVPTSADGKTYIYIGEAYSSYQVWLATENKAYQYYNGRFITLEEIKDLEAMTWINSTGQNAADIIANWATDATSATTTINGGLIQTHTIQASHLATNAIMSNNYQASQNAGSPYSVTGSFLDLDNGNFYTPNFGLDNVNGNAYFNGEITATSGQIGDDTSNHWQIGTVVDFNGNQSAAIESNGTSYIQSGDWMISNNRIDTRHYDNQRKYTYLYEDGVYWDFGLHTPSLTSDNDYENNFIYIRNHESTIPTLEGAWNYVFRVDRNGMIYINGVSLDDKYASIDGVSGAYLPMTGGSLTGNLSVGGNLTVTGTITGLKNLSVNGKTYNGTEAVSIGTIGAAYGGTGQTSLINSANALINALTTGSDIPVDNDYFVSQYVNGGTGTATYHRRPMSNLWEYIKSKINVTDGLLDDDYVPKTGGEFTGAVTVSDALIADEITSGNLIVNGVGRFTNGIYGGLTGDVVGTASKAVGDENGLNIASNYLKTSVANSTYLPLAGGTMTGQLKWNDTNALPEATSISYLLGIDAFSAGGTTKWININNITVGNATSATTATSATKLQIARDITIGNKTNSFDGSSAISYSLLDIGAVSKTGELQTTNPFAPPSLQGMYISKIDNAFYAADKRWNVTMTNVGLGNVPYLFDGSYENGVHILDGNTSVITFDFSTESNGYFPGYPYGYILVSFYANAVPASVSGRVYCNYSSHGIGWHDISFEPVSDSNVSHTVYRSSHQSYYQISLLEITIVGDTTNSYGRTQVAEIEMHLDRPSSSRNPFITKYAPETLYYALTAPKFIGVLEGNATSATSATTASKLASNISITVGNKTVSTINGGSTATYSLTDISKDISDSSNPDRGWMTKELYTTITNMAQNFSGGTITVSNVTASNGLTYNYDSATGITAITGIYPITTSKGTSGQVLIADSNGVGAWSGQDSLKIRRLDNKFTSRPTSANIASSSNRIGSLETFVATGSMTEGKPTCGDAHILHMNWDTTNGYDAQIAVPTDGGYHPQWRNMTGGTWGDWQTFLDENNYNSYSPTLTGTGASGTWGIDISGNANTATKLASVSTKTYTDITVEANNDPQGWLYFGSIHPTSYTAQWRIKYVVEASIDGVTEGYSKSIVEVTGTKSVYVAYSTYNTFTNTSYRPIYGHPFYWATEAGIGSGYGHVFGLRLHSGYDPVNYPRTIKIELLEAENCTVNYIDTPVVYASVPGTGSTNYRARDSFDGTTNGITISGDRNTHNDIYYSNYYRTSGTNGVYGYSLIMKDASGDYQSVITSYGTGTTKSANTVGFRFDGEILYHSPSSSRTSGTVFVDASYPVYGYIDFRYSSNCGTTLTTQQPLYLVGTFGTDDLFYLDTTQWWTQTLPTSDDGKVYILLGTTYSAYQFSLIKDHPVYIYKDGKIQDYYTWKQNRIGDYLPLSGGTMTGVLNISGQMENACINLSNSNYGMKLGIGTAGVNRGLWDINLNKWVVYSDATTSYFNGNATSATKATQDGSGNTITSYYVTLSTNQTILGTKTFSAMPVASAGLCVGNSGTAGGLSLWNDKNVKQYGLALRTTADSGKHGYVQGDYATYNYMYAASASALPTRGWIFKDSVNDKGVASISGAGNAVFNGSITVGGNVTNTSGCRQEFNEDLQCLEFIFN